MNEKVTLRTETRQVWCGNTPIGGGAPVSIQSMTNTKTEDTEATLSQIIDLADAGADIVRVAVPTIEAARNIREIKKRLADCGNTTPIVADIHFDYKIALAAVKSGADKIRINPGNIGGTDRLLAVTDAAGAAGIPIRIGVNGGSVEPGLQKLYYENPAKALAESAIICADIISGNGFHDIVVSVKSADIVCNTEAHRLLAAATRYPLHIGITEAGAGAAGMVKSAAGIGALLAMGIGDTIRVSLTGDPVNEIPVARDILRAVSLLPGQITLIACPTCGRCKTDLASLYRELSATLSELENERIKHIKLIQERSLQHSGKKPAHPDSRTVDSKPVDTRPVTVALMGCAVNGPGEASQADLGVALGASGGVYFEKGIQVGHVPYDKIVARIIDGVSGLIC